jgi:hypothetical protein
MWIAADRLITECPDRAGSPPPPTPADRHVEAQMEESTSADMASREAAWRAANTKWLIETQKPLRDREQFQVGEIAQALARQHGRLEVDDLERQRIVIDLFEWITRGEFNETDVLMLSGQPELFAPFLPAYQAQVEAAETTKGQEKLWHEFRPCGADRPAIALPGEGAAPTSLERALAPVMYRLFVDINVEAIVLRRHAARRYLEGCALGGAQRVLRDWFVVETTAPSGADAPRRNAANPRPPKDQSFEQHASNGDLGPEALREWIFNQRGQLRGFEKLYAAALKDSSVGTFKKKDLLAAFQAVYRTAPHRPPASGWPLQPDYQRRSEEKSLQKEV